MTRDKGTCSVVNCEEPAITRDLCNKHYLRWKKYKSTELPVLPPIEERFMARVEKIGECWIWIGSKLPSGYGRFGPTWKGKLFLAHRWSYEHFIGPIPEGLEVDHLCSTPACVNPAHLEAVTPAENQHRSRNTKLTPEQVLAIRDDTRRYALIAADHGISETNISNIKAGRAWAKLA